MWVQKREHKAVGAVLAHARAEAGLTQKELASLLRKPQSFVSSYESGQRRIDVLELVRITDALGADAREVLGEILTSTRVGGKPRHR